MVQRAEERPRPEVLYPPLTSSIDTDVVPGYPALSDEAAGWLKYMHRKIQLPSTWTKDGKPHEAWDHQTLPPVLDMYRYDLTFSTFAIAMMAEVTPAWREVYAKILDHNAEKMTSYWAWWDWIEQTGNDPKRNEYPNAYYVNLIPPGWAGVYHAPGWAANGLPPHEYNPDPVYGCGVGYMMWKGYFNLCMSLYEYVSGDGKYDQDFQLVYDDQIQFTYDHKRVTETIAQQWVTNEVGISCEIRMIWPWCNNLGGLGVRMYDILHGTSWYWTYQRWKNYYKKNYVGGPEGSPYQWLTLYNEPDLPYNMKLEQHQLAVNWMPVTWLTYPHDTDVARRLWEGAKKNFLIAAPDGAAFMGALPGVAVEDQFATATGMAVAKELDDEETYIQLRKWVETHYQPVFDPAQGEFYFTFGLNEPYPRGEFNAWTMPAYVGDANTWWKMFNQPNLRKFVQPTVTDVDYPTIRVRQAYYDEVQEALIFSMYSVDPAVIGKRTSFKVQNLVGGMYAVTMDGQDYRDWTLEGRTMVVNTTVGNHRFVFQRLRDVQP
jgi:hypothetical protein